MLYKSRPELSGAQLVADYQSAMITLATEATAKYEAERSERQLVQELELASTDTFLNPSTLGNLPTRDFARASLDAHIKKVQSSQLIKASEQHIESLEASDVEIYKGSKVTITVELPDSQPIDSLWFDEVNGYRTSPFKKTNVIGVIEDVLLSKNVLVIKPTLKRRLMNSNLKNFMVYIIDPQTMQPMVTITVH